MMYEPVKRLTGIHNIFQQAIGASQKVFEYLDRTEEIRGQARRRGAARFRERDCLRRRELPLSRHAQRIRARCGQPGSEGRRSRGAGGAERRGQDHAGQPAAALLRRDRGRGPDRRPRPARPELASLRSRSASWRRIRSCSTIRWRTTSPTAVRRPIEDEIRAAAATPWPTSSSTDCRRATTP